MMRRGPLDRYPPEWVLREAASNAVSGCIELHAERPATVYLDQGRIVHAVREIVAVGDTTETAVEDDEEAERALVVDVVAATLDQTSGWYYVDPLGLHRVSGRRRWPVDEVLAGARRRRAELESYGPWGTQPVRLAGTPQAPVTISPELWSVLVALCTPTEAPELADRLEWSRSDLRSALDDLGARGLLDGPAAVTPASPRPEAEGAGGDVDGAPAPDGADAPVAADAAPPVNPSTFVATPRPDGDRRGALRRLITALRPA